MMLGPKGIDVNGKIASHRVCDWPKKVKYQKGKPFRKTASDDFVMIVYIIETAKI